MPSQAQVCLSTGIFLDEGGDDRGRGSRGRRHTAAGSERQRQRSAWVRIDAAVLTIARLIGRQTVREAFERLGAANDNEPPERCED
jgi:hypothetical protein